MGNYVRVFCTKSEQPSVRAILDWAATKGCHMKVDPDFKNFNMDATDWKRVGILYKDDKWPFLSEINKDDGFMKEEITEFNNFLSGVKDAQGKETMDKEAILRHLKDTKFVVVTELSVNDDIDDEGYFNLGVFLTYFVQHCGGIIQVDGEGLSEDIKRNLQI